MMDELDLLKKDWQKKEAGFPKISYNDIQGMIWKKSSSIVKWILIISILEFILPHLLYLLPSMRSGLALWRSLGLGGYIIGFSIVQYGIVLYFIYQFYLRFKEISVLENTKNLMNKIIRTRKTVRRYVFFSLIMAFLSFVLLAIGIYLTDDLQSFLDVATDGEFQDVISQNLRWMLIGGILLFGLVVTVFIGGVYFLLYGLLLRKLKRNFMELERLEV